MAQRHRCLTTLIALVLAAAFAATDHAGTARADPVDRGVPDRDACDKVKRDIRRIESRLRAGYTARQGVRLEERLRELKERRRKVCR